MRTRYDHQSIMARLIQLGSYVDTQPMKDEQPRQFGARILIAIDPNDEFLDDEVRFQVLALINQRTL